MFPKLYYCNSPFHGSPMYILARYQKFQNSTAKLIFQCRKQNHILPLLVSLHWLPINVRLEIQTLSYLSFSFSAFLLFTCLIYSQCTHPKDIYALLLTIESYVSLNCEQRHLGIAHFLLLPPQYAILCP